MVPSARPGRGRRFSKPSYSRCAARRLWRRLRGRWRGSFVRRPTAGEHAADPEPPAGLGSDAGAGSDQRHDVLRIAARSQFHQQAAAVGALVRQIGKAAPRQVGAEDFLEDRLFRGQSVLVRGDSLDPLHAVAAGAPHDRPDRVRGLAGVQVDLAASALVRRKAAPAPGSDRGDRRRAWLPPCRSQPSPAGPGLPPGSALGRWRCGAVWPPAPRWSSGFRTRPWRAVPRRRARRNPCRAGPRARPRPFAQDGLCHRWAVSLLELCGVVDSQA